MDKIELSDQLIAELQSMDTPTVCNTRNTGAEASGLRLYDHKLDLHAASLPPMVGFARTATIRAAHPSDLSGSDARDLSDAYYAYIDEGPKPSVVVMQDLDGNGGYGSFWGEVNSNVHKRALAVSA